VNRENRVSRSLLLIVVSHKAKNVMKHVRRSLTLSALNIFIHHFFSLSSLREYLVDKRVYTFIHCRQEDEEDMSDDESNSESWKLIQDKRTQTRFDLMFLVRTAHERTPTAELLLEIMKHFDAVEFNYTFTNSPYNTVNSIYFAVGLSHKMSVLKGDSLDSWKKVANIPLQKQLESGFYAKAKMEELQALDNVTEADFVESDIEELVKTWLVTHCKVSMMRERTR
jgi:hypothetical protein